MNEFCNIIGLCLVSDIQSFQNGVLTLKSGRSAVTLQADEFTLALKESASEAGLLYNVEEDITVDKVPDAIASIYRIKRSAILQLKVSPGGESIYLGTLSLPAKVSITTHLNKDTLHIESKSFQSPL